MEKTKGFITVATGKEEYFQLAVNLLHSYRYFCRDPLPFAVLTDRKNAYTDEFDDLVLFTEPATNSYLDKLRLAEYLPYDINIFIDADCLAYGNLNQLFEDFKNADDVSCFGRVLPLSDHTGWFEYENLGLLQKQVSYVVGLHGGIYYMRRGELCSKVFENAKEFSENYQDFKFKGKFQTPGDEPLIALSMAVNQCKPIPFINRAICCYWEHVDNMKIDLSIPAAEVKGANGYKTDLLHWGTRFTREAEYQEQVEILHIMEQKNPDYKQQLIKCHKKYGRMISKRKRTAFMLRVKNKIKRTLHIQ